jgi:hypothetical protein
MPEVGKVGLIGATGVHGVKLKGSAKPASTLGLRRISTRRQNREKRLAEVKNRRFDSFGQGGTRRLNARNPARLGDFRQEKGPGDFPSPSIWWWDRNPHQT